ncbi:hypothetical protein [Nocardia sp. NPDC052112]|uniref:hypothetical protein n=1 Tax=Nocardia sp. NPDC052112 TaxID=3155646 RepID=UPI003437CA0A
MIDGGGNGEAPEVRGPVNSPGKKAEDPWKDIAEQVHAKKLRFEPAAAAKAANECLKALDGISRIQEKLTGMDPLAPLSQLKSGSALATLFNGTRHGLGEVLQTHSTALNEMLNTFKDAGKKYIEVDLDSAHDMNPDVKKGMLNDLDRIKPKSAADAGKFQTKMPKSGKHETEYMDVDYPGVPVKSKEPQSASELEEQGVAFGSRDFINGGKKLTEDQIVDSSQGRAPLSQIVKPAELPDKLVNSMGSNQTQVEALKLWRLESGPNSENPASQSWRDLYNLGQTAGHAVKPVLDAALAWQSMANELKKTGETLAQYAVDESQWKSHGANGAIKAVENYHTKAKALATQITDMGKTLEYTSEWLANTKVGMPQKPDPPKPEMVTAYTDDPLTGSTSYNVDMAATNQRNLAIYRQNMENNYVQGVQTSSLFVPSMDELPVTTPKKSTSSENPDGKQDTNGKGGGTGTTPSGGGTGTTPSGGGTGTVPTTASNYSSVDPSKLAQGVDDSTTSQAETPNYTATTPATADSTQSATQTSGLDGLSQAAGLAQQGIGGAQSAMQAAAQAAQQAAASGLTPARANAPAFSGGSGASSAGGGGASKIGGGAGLSGSAAAALQKEADAARLFPRAGAAGPASQLGRLSGIPGAGVPASGAPGSPGAGAGQGQGQGKEYKRPKYLESNKHLEEALGEAPAVAKAVVEK